jgi:hypothetical protein
MLRINSDFRFNNKIKAIICDKCTWILNWTISLRSWWMICPHSCSNSCRCPETQNCTLPLRSWWMICPHSRSDSCGGHLLQWKSHYNRCSLSYHSSNISINIPISVKRRRVKVNSGNRGKSWRLTLARGIVRPSVIWHSNCRYRYCRTFVKYNCMTRCRDTSILTCEV